MTNPMTTDQIIATLRNALETIGLILDNPTPERAHRCQVIASSALTQTLLPVVKERTLIPHINEQNILTQIEEFFKS